MLLGREEEEMKSSGEGSSTGKWLSTAQESWEVVRCHYEDLHSWRGYDSTRYVYIYINLFTYKVHERTTMGVQIHLQGSAKKEGKQKKIKFKYFFLNFHFVLEFLPDFTLLLHSI